MKQAWYLACEELIQAGAWAQDGLNVVTNDTTMNIFSILLRMFDEREAADLQKLIEEKRVKADGTRSSCVMM